MDKKSVVAIKKLLEKLQKLREVYKSVLDIEKSKPQTRESADFKRIENLLTDLNGFSLNVFDNLWKDENNFNVDLLEKM
jgi:hypothetical protein